MKDYKQLEANANTMLEKATINRAKWETYVAAIDYPAAITEDYESYLREMSEQFSNKKITLEQGRYLFNQWGNFSAEPKNIDYIEIDVDGTRCMQCLPHGGDKSRVIIACHGGAYTYGSMYSHRKVYAHLASKVNCMVLLVDYCHTPECEWPKPVDDIVKVYMWLLEQGISNKHIAVTGDSAGGALSVALLLRCKILDLPMISAAMPISPWGDLEAITPVYSTNTKDLLNNVTMVRAGGSILDLFTDLHNPELAPIYIEDFTGFPPIYIQVGAYENFADDARIIAGKAYEAGVNVKCEFIEKMQHCFHQMAGYSKDADTAIERLADWVKPYINLNQD